MPTDTAGPYQYVLYEKRGHTAVITINRPEVLNALHYPANEELFDIWTDFMDDPDVWTAVLTGAGDRAFCAGADIKYMASISQPVPTSVREASDSRIQFAGLVHRRITKPIIAAVNGYCLGGGLETAMACDIVIASEHARFGTPEIKNTGGYPASGGVHRLPRHVPRKIAMQMLLTGEHLSADEALRYGLINKVVPTARLMPEALALAEIINSRPPMAARAIKEMVDCSLDLPLEYPVDTRLCAWDLDDDIGGKLRATEDWKSREGPRAFVEKRKPVWLGR
ncbi:MAG: enoyl-CoA hydratase/isomerase family protein [Chloroflexi bacterium]|nr:enoyl-CoA hydratase/isomerase family protein [Chloroflexota bacterium]